ncbi:OmpA family protein [Conchiformibius steedae]|uniref:OmpA family protein n=1 Tax=Conchiformibius steedae TaxID=153493 RepID=UPI0026E97782|nr:OmpA family protein [Conchiformibius steedae]
MILKTILTAALLAASLGAQANLSDVNRDGEVSGELVWPDPSSTTFPTKRASTVGVYKTDEELLLLREGMSKAAVQDMLGRPQFHEGFFNVREWDYIVNDHCQLKILFDSNDNAKSYHWREQSCVPQKKEPPVQTYQAPPQPPVKMMTLNGDALFEFDRYNLNESGANQLRTQVLDRLRRYQAEGFTYTSVEIVGHTDRLGSPEYNNQLSQNRAQTVAAFLSQNGVNPSNMKAFGAGASEPVVYCQGTAPTPELKACLSPNRRVTVSFQ